MHISLDSSLFVFVVSVLAQVLAAHIGRFIGSTRRGVRMLLGFGGLLLALGGLYWLISDGDRRQPLGSSELLLAHP